MDTELTEADVVENPTLKAAYNLAPLHQNQPLKWDYEVELIGRKVSDKVLHICEVCELPILVYGRLLPCKHIFCFQCARRCGPVCKRCDGKVQKVEELALGTVYVCTHGAPKHSTEGCRRTYLSARDLQSHYGHRHLEKKASSEAKASQNVQPQLPLTQQQAAALQQASQSSAVHNEESLQPCSQQPSQTMMSSAQFTPAGLREQASPRQESGQLLGPSSSIFPGMPTSSMGMDVRTSSTMSHGAFDPKSNQLGMGFNPPPLQPSDQGGVYRPLDGSSLPHHLQQQQQPPQLQQHQQHLPLQSQQHPQQLSHMMGGGGLPPGSPGMLPPPMSKPMPRFSQPPQVPMSSSLLSRPGTQMNTFQSTTTSMTSSEMRMSPQMRHQLPPNPSLHHPQQPPPTGLMPPHSMSQPPLPQKGFDRMERDMGMEDLKDFRKMDQFGMDQFGGNRRNLGHFGNSQIRDNLPSDFDSRQNRDKLLGDFGKGPGRESMRGDFGSSHIRDDLRGHFGSRDDLRSDFGSRENLRGDFGSSRSRNNLPGDFGSSQNRDDLRGDIDNRQGRDNLRGMQNMDNLGSLQQRNAYNRPQDVDVRNADNLNSRRNRDEFSGRQIREDIDSRPKRDDFNTRQSREGFGNRQNRDDFNIRQSRDDFDARREEVMDTSKALPPSQGGASRNNVNLITVPIQDEGQFRPLPFVGHSQQPPLGGADGNKNFPPFPSNMPVSKNPPLDFPPGMGSSQSMGGRGDLSSPMLPFNRPGTAQERLLPPGIPPLRMSQPSGNLGGVSSIPGPGFNQVRPPAVGGIHPGANLNMPPQSVPGALPFSRSQGSGSLLGSGQGGLMSGAGSLHTPHNPNPRFNNPSPTQQQWNSGNSQSIHPRMSQSLPPSRGDDKFKRNYYR